METIVVLSDQHARYDDRKTEKAVVQFLADFQPNILINNGDLGDFESLGQFRLTPAGKQSLNDDIRACQAILARQRRACPNAAIKLIAGNHEERLAKYLVDHAEAFWDLPLLSVPHLLDVAALDIQYLGPYGAGFLWHSVFIYHGARLSQIAAYAARQELIDAGTSGISGHTHRMGMHSFSDRSGPHAWYEGGCLCHVTGPRVPPMSLHRWVTNWQQGFVVGYYHNGVWNIVPVHIVKHRFIFGGKEYG